MCELCTMKPADRYKAMQFRARQLEQFASQVMRLADGTLDPHSEEVKSVAAQARQLIRYLVEDWL